MMILKTSRSNLSSNDQLALDLPFAATKSLAARVGPTPTFTRGSGATYIGSDGLIHGIDTSTTSNTIGTGSRTFTLAATAGQDQFWRAGDAVEASNGSNSMVGTVTSYDAATQSLVCNMISTGGSGTFTSWRIGYRGPRFDHTSAGVCRGLLIEESRTNLSWPSAYTTADLGFGVFPAGSTTTTFNQLSSIGPSSNGAVLMLETATTQVHGGYAGINRASNPAAITIVSGTVYTASIYVKASGRTRCRFSFNTPSNIDGIFAAFNLSGDGSITTNSTTYGSGASAAGLSASITKNADGWFRLKVSGSLTNTSGFITVETLDDSGNRSYLGDVTKGLLITNAQLEAGSFPTSYIPTTAGSVVRSADVCDITGANFTSFYNQSEGSLACAYSIPTGFTGNRYAASIEDTVGGTQNGFAFRNTNAASSFIAGGGYTSTIGATTTTVDKHILAYSGLSEFVYVKNSVVGTTTGSGTRNPSLPIRMSIGSLEGSNAFNLCGHISSVRYYKKRLPNAKLQALTA